MWLDVEQRDRDRAVFEAELQDFVPAEILDFHVHVFDAATLADNGPYSSAGHPLDKYDLDDLAADLEHAYPGRRTAAVCFGVPSTAYDRAANNRYLAEHCDRRRFFPFRLLDPGNDTPEELRRDVRNSGFLGLKPYLRYARKGDPEQIEIADMLPDWAMRVADELGLVVMLHIPRRQRLADPCNQEQLVRLCERFPNARIVLAHVGRAYYLSNIVGQLDRLAKLPNLWYDLAMLNNWEVLEYLFDRVDPGRLLYATDTPIAVAPGKSVEINNRYSYITPVPWELSITDDAHRVAFTSFINEELRAIRKAVERCGRGREFVQALFHDNGMRLLESVGTRSPDTDRKSE